MPYIDNITYNSILYAHLWGRPWTDDLKIFDLSDIQLKLLLEAWENIDISIIKSSREFKFLWDDVANWINNNGAQFFRLSSISAKDSFYESTVKEPLLQANKVEKIFEVFIRSMRIAEELDGENNSKLVLKKWNDNITVDNEYRCLIFNFKVSVVVKRVNCEEGRDEINKAVKEFVNKYKYAMPYHTVCMDVAVLDNLDVIFIEFNPIDDELDLFGVPDTKFTAEELGIINTNADVLKY